jgi:hypothetical protein
MRRTIVVVMVVVLLCGTFSVASAQGLVTTFPGTPLVPGIAAPVAFPSSADPGRVVPHPIQPQTGVAASGLPASRGGRDASRSCNPVNPAGTQSIAGSYLEASGMNWSVRQLSRDALVLGDAKTWHSLFMPGDGFVPVSSWRFRFSAAPSAICSPN